ncbi:MAG: alpha-glucan family phosphorylase [Actinomycetota bacterium]|nr:alpha-glucan family phosphorylase [Actinomycetota bacterium]
MTPAEEASPSIPPVPQPLEGLLSLAGNLRWSWNRRAADLFRELDAGAWTRAGHDPMKALHLVEPQRLAELARDRAFVATVRDAGKDLDAYLLDRGPYDSLTGAPPTVAYFSPEFGVTEALPVYSGGLGVLAGDHLKAASDLGVSLVGIGLLYRHGYFLQHLAADGWQQESYPTLEPTQSVLTLLRTGAGAPLTIEVELGEALCRAAIWRVRVGRVPLLLLDSDVPSNRPDERAVTDVLYGGDTEHRLRQEILLGIGGVRALHAAGYSAQVWHSNEGHAGFLGLERIRGLVQEGLSFDAALASVRASTIFTTHTPVPAGIDIFERQLMERYFSAFAQSCGISFDELMDVGRDGHNGGAARGSRFNMAVMGFNLAGRANGVSKLHGEVSRAMFSGLWPRLPAREVPIGSITNGVHVASWMGPEMAAIMDARRPGWTETAAPDWSIVREVPDDELWAARRRARMRMVQFVRDRLGGRAAGAGDDALDPEVLTIGFARRFAQYKRGTLLLTDRDRLRRLLLGERPVQIVMAGKAHPRDDGGKEMIRQIISFTADPELRCRFVFLEGYDMELGRVLAQGSDLWLNHPRRPLEACGTSGMKAAINGGINCSILDGWWDECFDGSNGWAIGTREVCDDPGVQDRADAESVYRLLEDEITGLFYQRAESGIPEGWVATMKASLATLGPAVSGDRMMREYLSDLYRPAAAAAAAPTPRSG